MKFKTHLTIIEILSVIMLVFIMAQYVIGTVLTNRWDFLGWAVACLLGVFLILWDKDEISN